MNDRDMLKTQMKALLTKSGFTMTDLAHFTRLSVDELEAFLTHDNKTLSDFASVVIQRLHVRMLESTLV